MTPAKVRSAILSVVNTSSYQFVKGMIMMWSGNTIPSGWAICNGQNGTPDLRNRFIVGAGASYNVNATGGSNTVALSVSNMPSHSHSITGYSDHAGTGYEWIMMAGEIRGATGPHAFSTTSVGSSTAHENRPPYYALYYIMKL